MNMLGYRKFYHRPSSSNEYKKLESRVWMTFPESHFLTDQSGLEFTLSDINLGFLKYFLY